MSEYEGLIAIEVLHGLRRLVSNALDELNWDILEQNYTQESTQWCFILDVDFDDLIEAEVELRKEMRFEGYLKMWRIDEDNKPSY